MAPTARAGLLASGCGLPASSVRTGLRLSCWREADALDRLLEQAPRASGADIDALKERIVAAALRSGAPQLAVVASGKPAFGRVMPVQTRRAAFAARFGRGEWPAAALLAASLVLGVMLGSAGALRCDDAGGGAGRRLRQHRIR